MTGSALVAFVLVLLVPFYFFFKSIIYIYNLQFTIHSTHLLSAFLNSSAKRIYVMYIDPYYILYRSISRHSAQHTHLRCVANIRTSHSTPPDLPHSPQPSSSILSSQGPNSQSAIRPRRPDQEAAKSPASAIVMTIMSIFFF
jgi:hypothetical protein